MQFIDLKSQYEFLQDKIDLRIKQVLNHGQYIMGPEVHELESQLASYVDVKYAITCANGTDALQLALMALGIGPGDAVFTTPFTFFATAEAISFIGATPVFVDIDAKTYNIDYQQLDIAINKVLSEGNLTVKAVIAVDLFGLPADYPSLTEVCSKYDLKLIEDAAQGFGGSIDHRKAGCFGDIATTSFFPAKPLGCYGDGGALFTNDDRIADLLRSYRVHGKGKDKYDNLRIGMNSRLDTIQAAVLLEKLAVFDSELALRQKIADAYNAHLSDRLVIPFVPEKYQSSWAQYSLLAADCTQRQKWMDDLKAEGVPTMVYYSNPLHLQSAFADLGYVQGDFPCSEDVAQRVFSLPMSPYIDHNLVLNAC